MVSVQRELEASQTHSSKLAGKLEDVERVCMQKDQEVRDMAEQVRTAKVSLSTKEGKPLLPVSIATSGTKYLFDFVFVWFGLFAVELRHLKDQLQVMQWIAHLFCVSMFVRVYVHLGRL